MMSIKDAFTLHIRDLQGNICKGLEEVDGKAVHGLTMPQIWRNDKGQKEQFRAYIYVPKAPEFNVVTKA